MKKAGKLGALKTSPGGMSAQCGWTRVDLVSRARKTQPGHARGPLRAEKRSRLPVAVRQAPAQPSLGAPHSHSRGPRTGSELVTESWDRGKRLVYVTFEMRVLQISFFFNLKVDGVLKLR